MTPNAPAIRTPTGATRARTNAQVALSWLASNLIVVPIPGARNAAQAEENACAADIQLTREELNELDMVAREVKIDYFP